MTLMLATIAGPAAATALEGAAATTTPARTGTAGAPAASAAATANVVAPASVQQRPILSMPPRPAQATAHVAQPAKGEAPSAAGAVGGTLFALVLVVGLIFGLAWIARRMPGVAGRGNARLRVVASLALGPRERVVVVDVGGTQLLLGVGAGGTRTLHTLETPLPAEAPSQPAPFAQLLAQHFGKKQ